MILLFANCPKCGEEVPTAIRPGPSGMPRIGALHILCPACAQSALVPGTLLHAVAGPR
jgi:hypothetical protein